MDGAVVSAPLATDIDEAIERSWTPLVRKWLAASLHRLATRVDGRPGGSSNFGTYLPADTAIYTAGTMGEAAQAEYERRESRGW